MEAFTLLLSGLATAITFTNLLFCLIGVTVGMLVGVLPGLGPSAGMAVLIPITFGMDPIPAVVMLCGIYYGAMYGGTITSVLINTPGETASVITCLDGYPMAKQGRAGVALGIAAIGSFIGGTFATFGLGVIGVVVASVALKFGPPEFFALMILGLSMIVGLMGKSIVRGIISALIGLCLSMVGMDLVTGTARFTFGEIYLMDGFNIVTVAVGLFGLSELLLLAEENWKKQPIPNVKGVLPNRDEWKPALKSIGRGTGLGFITGLIPGTNSALPALFSYSIEKRLAKDPSRFGKGAIEGVAGPETANNSYVGGALIPLFTLGIPSSPTIAILLGAFMMHGLAPGPTLFQNEPQFVWTVIASMFVGNVILVIMNLPLAGFWAKISLIPIRYLLPVLLVILITGSYTINNSMFDVGVMLAFGVIGYVFKKVDIPLAPVLLTFVLGGMIENSLLQSLTMFHGDFFQIFNSRIATVILVISLLVICVSIWAEVKNKKGALSSDDE